MRTSSAAFIAIATALSFSSHVVAQNNDDCSGAIPVSQGINGPFSSVGSTTSTPGWPCAAGGNDVWFVYVAPGPGSLTVDLCGSSYDTALQLFNGNSGCGGITSLGCNDDSCGLQSMVAINVAVADTIFIRVGGYAGNTGTFSMNVAGPAGTGAVAQSTPYGTGCVAQAGSFYELIQSGAFDLNNTTMTLFPSSPGYVAIPFGSYVAPTASAVTLTLSDDSDVTQSLTMPFPYDGGVTSALTVCSNGFVSVATGNTTAYIPNVGTMLSSPATAWWSWHDFNPTAGGGQVKFEEVGSIAYVTWDGVWDFGGSAANANTFQMQFDSAVGSVAYAWQTMSTAGTAHLVGYSPAGASMDPGPLDISVELPIVFIVAGQDLFPLALVSDARPVIGTTINLNTSNITATAPFGALALGFTDPALNLASIGMDGCTQYADHIAVLLYLPLGATSASVPFSVPNAPGVTVLTQSFIYDPGAVPTALGAIASNGVSLYIAAL